MKVSNTTIPIKPMKDKIMKNKQTKQSLRKASQKEALLRRLDLDLRNLYHNASPWHPDVCKELWDDYNAWFEDVAAREVEYIRDGLGSTEKEYAKSLKGGCKTERYYYYVSQITQYGNLYTWGRGGRTLAPNDLINTRGCSSFSIKDADDFNEKSKEYTIQLILTLEAFNHYVREWNSKKNLQAMWEYEIRDRMSEKRAEMRDARLAFRELKQSLKVNGVLNGAVCDVIRKELINLRKRHKDTIKEFLTWQECIS